MRNLINSYCWNYHLSANDIWFHSVSSLSGLEHIFETLIDFLSWKPLNALTLNTWSRKMPHALGQHGTTTWVCAPEPVPCREAPQWEAHTLQPESSPHLLQWQKAWVQRWTPRAAKNQSVKAPWRCPSGEELGLALKKPPVTVFRWQVKWHLNWGSGFF